jgi:hypothetical protein
MNKEEIDTMITPKQSFIYNPIVKVEIDKLSILQKLGGTLLITATFYDLQDTNGVSILEPGTDRIDTSKFFIENWLCYDGSPACTI